MAASGTFGYIRFNPNLDADVIEEILDDLKSELSDIVFHPWEHRIDIGDPIDFHLIDFVISTIKTFKAESFVEDLAFNG
jgi:hypothetical protein